MIGLSSLIRRTTPSSFTYICEKSGTSLTDKVRSQPISLSSLNNLKKTKYYEFFCSNLYDLQMDELACFAPGMIALGSSGYDSEDSKKFLTLAEEVKSSDLFPLWDDKASGLLVSKYLTLFGNFIHI